MLALWTKATASGPALVLDVPQTLCQGMEGKTKKKTSKALKTRQVPITALIRWEDKFREEYNWGEVLMLMKDGRVWARAAFRDRDGKVQYKKARCRQWLSEWRKQFGKDLERMASEWRFMIGNREKGFEVVSQMLLEGMAFDV